MNTVRTMIARVLVRMAAAVDPKLAELLRPIWRPQK